MSYVLMQNCARLARYMAVQQRDDKLAFDRGHWIAEAPADFACTLLPRDVEDAEKINDLGDLSDGQLPAYLLGPVPLWSTGFIAAIKRAGVHNFQVFDVALIDLDNQVPPGHYKAVNVLGCVDARCFVTTHDNPLMVVDQSLYLDPEHCDGLELFRVAHVPGAIVLHKDVVAALFAMGFKEPVSFAGT